MAHTVSAASASTASAAASGPSAPSALNLLIRDANGHPQMVKVVPAKATNQIQLQPDQLNQLKSVFKVPSTSNTPIQCSSDSGKMQTLSTVIKTEEDMSFYPKTIRGYRKRNESDSDIGIDYSSKRRKMVERAGKGLRHFSMKVCEKVKKKGFTSYNEVADELVAEFTEGINACPDNQHYDQKNIRRRVYDALNVLMAMNIISKEKKEIRWLGLPTNSVQECSSLEKVKQLKMERIRMKTQQLYDLIIKQISLKCLVERNREAESKGMIPPPSNTIQLPFLVINTSNKTVIDCCVSDDKLEYVFNFDNKFLILDDVTVLKHMGLLSGLEKGDISESNLRKAKNMVPKSLASYVEQLNKGCQINIDDLLNIKTEMEEVGEASANGEEELEECEDDYSMGGSEEEDDADNSSDIDVN